MALSLRSGAAANIAWRHLPRDARDTLFQLAVIGWTLLPHLSHLAPWCGALALLILLWRARLALLNAPLPRRWVVAAVLATAMGLTVWSEGTLVGREAGVTMLVVLMALKTLELRARRDALVVFFLGFFLVLTHFLYSQSLAVAVAMLISVWGLLTALVLAHLPVGRPSLARAGGVAARAALLGAPIMIVLFLLFPRLAPLWGMPADAAGRTGLSGTLRMGGVAQIANDDSIAMRVRFFGREPDPDDMYFRGPVLGSFDGREWTRVMPTFPVPVRTRSDVQLLGDPVDYELTMEPNRLPLLPLLELTPDRPGAAPELEGWTLALRADVQWQLDRPVTERIRVRAKAWPVHRHGPRSELLGLRDYVSLPPGFNPRTLEFAAALRQRPEFAQADAQTLAQALFAHIRSGGYTYTLEPGPYGRDAVDEFWFDRKLGFCEHFSVAFVVIMRALDVPARIVTGYQGSDPRPVDGYYVVRQSHAHAWAEYWQPGVGWQRADPTAAVAPDRIQASRSLEPARGLVAGALGSVNPELAARLRGLWEAANNRWNQWVLNYSRSRQFDLLRHLGVPSPDWRDLAYALIGLLCTASLAAAGWALWDRHRQDPWQRLQRRIADRLRTMGVEVAPHDPPRRRAALVRERLGAAGEAAARALEALDRLRYAPPAARLPGRDWWRDFERATPGRSGAPPAVALAIAAAPVLALLLHATPAQAARKARAASAPAKTEEARSYRGHPAAQAFAGELADRHGLPRDWVQRQLDAARRQESVRRLIMPPPAGTAKNWAAYLGRFVEPVRVAAGAAFWQAHARELGEAEERWGVPAELVVGIIGVETFYGRITGSHRVIDALATLSFDFPPGRKDRSAFFRSELEEFLLWCRRERIDCAQIKGSFAGAIGLPQFMPGSINRHALDFDGDGHIDLQRSAADAIGSVANYMVRHGWQRGLATHFAVKAPVDTADRAALLGPDIVPTFTAAQFAERGAMLDAEGSAHGGALALVELQNGDAAPSYFAGTQNFYAITRYNWSAYYAMAVISLGQAVRAARAGPPARSGDVRARP